MYNILIKTVLSDTFIDFLFLTIHTARHNKTPYRLISSTLHDVRFSIGNDLETSLVLRSA